MFLFNIIHRVTLVLTSRLLYYITSYCAYFMVPVTATRARARAGCVRLLLLLAVYGLLSELKYSNCDASWQASV